jgi:peroxiredoxin
MYKICLIVGLAVLVIAIMSLSSCSNTGSQALPSGTQAPGFTLKDLNGKAVSLSDFGGKAVLINFWATTCPPCVEEMPNFQSLYSDWSNRGDRVLLTVDLGEDADTLRSFTSSRHYTFPVLIDVAYQAAEKYGIQYTPTTVLIDKNGNIQFRVIGAFPDKSAIVKKVREYLSD